MGVRSIRHFGVSVCNLNEQVQILKDMGFIAGEIKEEGGEYLKQVTGGDVSVRTCKIALPGGAVIELCEWDSQTVMPGFHIAVTVDSDDDFGGEVPAVDMQGRKVKYIWAGELMLEKVKEVG